MTGTGHPAGRALSNWLFDNGAVVREGEDGIGVRTSWTEARGAGSSEGFHVPTRFAVD